MEKIRNLQDFFVVKRKNIYQLLVFSLLLPVVISSCSKEENSFTIGNNLVEQESYIQLLDTFKVNLSTILLDSLPTSGNSVALCGRYQDNVFGKVSSESYFIIDKPSSTTIISDEIYDSTILVLNYSGYSYGDTTIAQTINVHQLTTGFDVNSSNYLYNSTKMAYSPDLKGSVHYIPTPHKGATLSIRINDVIGKKLFNLLATNAEEITTTSNFVNYFKGLALVPGDSSYAAVIGFLASDSRINLEVCTHRVAETLENYTHDFPLVYSTYQYNHITSDLNNTGLSELSGTNSELLAGQTGDRAYIQGLTGITTRIQFPYLSNLLLFEKAVLIKAELIIKPDMNSYNKFPLPDSLELYTTDKNNSIGSAIVNSAGNIQVANFVMDNLYNENTSYTFDITYYLKNELADQYYNDQNGLLLFFPAIKYYTTLDRMVVDAKTYKPQLKIYMMFY